MIERGVLPVSYYCMLEDGAALPVGIAPAFLVARTFERERIKDKLRDWVGVGVNGLLWRMLNGWVRSMKEFKGKGNRNQVYETI